MDMRYMVYAISNKKYYCPQKKRTKKTMLKIPELPEGWFNQMDDVGHWMYCFKKRARLQKQGWKIHISCLVKDAQITLDSVTPILFEHEVMFKYVASTFELNLKNWIGYTKLDRINKVM